MWMNLPLAIVVTVLPLQASDSLPGAVHLPDGRRIALGEERPADLVGDSVEIAGTVVIGDASGIPVSAERVTLLPRDSVRIRSIVILVQGYDSSELESTLVERFGDVTPTIPVGVLRWDVGGRGLFLVPGRPRSGGGRRPILALRERDPP